MRRKVLMVGRTRYALPLDASLARKFDALSAELDVRVLAAKARAGIGSRRALSPLRARRARQAGGGGFLGAVPVPRRPRAARHAPRRGASQGGHETALVLLGRTLARVPTKVVMDVHGDPGAATRLYGSRARAALAPLGDAMTRLALRGPTP